MMLINQNKKNYSLFLTYILQAVFIFSCANYKKPSIQQTAIYSKSNLIYLTMCIGKETLENRHNLKRLLSSINQSSPCSTVYIITSVFTKVLYDEFSDYNLKIIIEPISNISVQDIKRKYNNKFKYKTWFWVHRYEFYEEFFSKHKEIEYVMIMDEDSLLLKDPNVLFAKDPEYIHMMHDFYNFSVRKDSNFRWLKGLHQRLAHKNLRDKCHIKDLKYPLYSDELAGEIPFNSGLMIGRADKIYQLCKFLSKLSLCVDIYNKACDQGIFNYLYFNGQISEQGFKIKEYYMNDRLLISCCEHLTPETATKSKEWFLIHHYRKLKRKRNVLQQVSQQVLQLLQLD